MSLTSLFPDAESQKAATTIIGLVSIFSAVLITMNQYVKSQQMMEAHRAAGLAYGKLHRIIMNELALRRDQRQNALEFLKLIRTEQDRLENSSPSILPAVIKRFNIQFADRDIEKPEIAGDLDEVTINQSSRHRRRDDSGGSPVANISRFLPSPPLALRGVVRQMLTTTPSFSKTKVAPEKRVKTEDSVPENIIVGGESERPPTPPLPPAPAHSGSITHR